jgi:hypothetical protein
MPVIRMNIVKDGFRFVANIRGDARNAVGGELYHLVCQSAIADQTGRHPMWIKVGAPAPDAAADYWIKGAHGPRRIR